MFFLIIQLYNHESKRSKANRDKCFKVLRE